MKNFITGLFQKGKREETGSVALRVENYSPDLIPTLKDDHRQLLIIWERIGGLVGANIPGKKKYRKIAEHLSRFRTLFVDHVQLEHGKLYSQIRYAYVDDPDVIANMKTFKNDMGQIQKAVNKFMFSWSEERIAREPVEFQKEFVRVGKALGARIKREESRLYPCHEEIPNRQKYRALTDC